jgi:hypothetical protein
MSYENYGGNFAGNGQDQNSPPQVPGGQDASAPGQNNGSGAPPMQFAPADPSQGGQPMQQPSGQPGGPSDQKTTLWYFHHPTAVPVQA